METNEILRLLSKSALEFLQASERGDSLLKYESDLYEKVHSAELYLSNSHPSEKDREVYVLISVDDKLPEKENDDTNQTKFVAAFQQEKCLGDCFYDYEQIKWIDYEGTTVYPTDWLEKQTIQDNKQPLGYTAEDMKKYAKMKRSICEEHAIFEIEPLPRGNENYYVKNILKAPAPPLPEPNHPVINEMSFEQWEKLYDEKYGNDQPSIKSVAYDNYLLGIRFQGVVNKDPVNEIMYDSIGKIKLKYKMLRDETIDSKNRMMGMDDRGVSYVQVDTEISWYNRFINDLESAIASYEETLKTK